jgi:hypothetical protein
VAPADREFLHKPHEVGVGSVVLSGYDEVILDQFGDVGDAVDHDGAPLPCGFLGATGHGARAQGQGKRTESSGITGAKRRLAAP